MFAATMTTLFFYSDWGATILTWYVLVIAVCVIRVVVARRNTRQPPVPAPMTAVVPFIAWSILTAAILTSFPVWVTMETDGFPFAYMIVLFLGTFWAASFVHAPVLLTAIAFMFTQLGVAVAAAVLAGIDWERAALTALYTVGVGAGLHIIRQHSAIFRQSIRQQLELEQKNETIGLILKEHEDQSSDWLWQTDTALRIVDPSIRFADALDVSKQTLSGRPIAETLTDAGMDGNTETLAQIDDHFAARESFRDIVVPLGINEQTCWFSLSGRPIYDRAGAFSGYRGVMADITVARRAQARAAHLTHHDTLTDLPNRTQFNALIRRALTRGRAFTLLSIDLDGFKAVNEGFGHHAGDRLLVEIARRLQDNVEANEFVARLGDDEFVVQTWRLATDSIESLCRDLIAAASRPITIDGISLTVGASIGVAFAPADGDTTDEILKNADSALYRAKTEGRGSFRFFSATMDRKLQVRQRLIQDLRSALDRDELFLHYQPFIDAASGAITGCEALIRWQHAERGMISPAEFIPLAEENGLIVPIGSWVIEQACREAATWDNNRRVAVNVSPAQFRDQGLHERIRSILKTTRLAPRRLEIEVTETVLVTNPQAALETLRRIRALGVRVALDDFGTGYSSLSYLRLFPFDKIKLDRAFIQDLETRQDSQVIVHAVLDIAKGLGMTLTAEGIETSGQADYLRGIGCHEFQGFLFARPAPASELANLMLRRPPPPPAFDVG
ncbi:EAL domain-containing protein [Salinisphaera sp. Q1T1-3]|nr:EAL domain-containing protein [Salinisphaera sp. Q1T1-3]